MVALPYQRNGVAITAALAKSAEGSFPVAGLASVGRSDTFGLLTIIGVFLAVATLFGGIGSGSFLVLVGLAAATGISFYLGNKSKKYCVNIETSSGARKTFLETRDRAFADEVKLALETAISERG